jgi:hypothetical protein
MRLTCGEGNGVSLDGRTSQSIARIDRTVRKVDICRTFVRLIAVMVPPADERLPTAVSSTDRARTRWFAALSYSI